MSLFGGRKEKSAGDPPAADAENADVQPFYAPFLEKKGEWIAKHGLRCYQVATMNMMIDSVNDDQVGILHLEPGIALVVFPPGEDTPLHSAKVDAAPEVAESWIREATGGHGEIHRLGWSKHYPAFSRDRWADQHEELKPMMSDGSFGFVTLFDMDWLDARIRERAAAHGLRVLDRIGNETDLKQFRFAKDETITVNLLRMLVETAVDVYPVEYLLERVDSIAQMEKRIAKWAQEVEGAGVGPFDPQPHSAIAPGGTDLNRWRSVPEDPMVSTSPQIVEITKFMEKADGVEGLLWYYLAGKFPANLPGYEGEPAFVVAGGSLATVSFDKEKGILLYFDHPRSNLQWRIWVLQKLTELASIFRKFREQDGHALESQTGGKDHFSAVVRVGKAEEAKGPGKGMAALGARIGPGPKTADPGAGKKSQ